MTTKKNLKDRLTITLLKKNLRSRCIHLRKYIFILTARHVLWSHDVISSLLPNIHKDRDREITLRSMTKLFSC